MSVWKSARSPCCSRSHLQIRGRGVAGRHHYVGGHRARGLALDDRARGAAREISVSEDRRSISRERHARADGDDDPCPRGAAREQLAQALDSGTKNLARKRCRCRPAPQTQLMRYPRLRKDTLGREATRAAQWKSALTP